MAHPPRFERGTYRLEGGCSIQLSYGCLQPILAAGAREESDGQWIAQGPPG